MRPLSFLLVQDWPGTLCKYGFSNYILTKQRTSKRAALPTWQLTNWGKGRGAGCSAPPRSSAMVRYRWYRGGGEWCGEQPSDEQLQGRALEAAFVAIAGRLARPVGIRMKDDAGKWHFLTSAEDPRVPGIILEMEAVAVKITASFTGLTPPVRVLGADAPLLIDGETKRRSVDLRLQRRKTAGNAEVKWSPGSVAVAMKRAIEESGEWLRRARRGAAWRAPLKGRVTARGVAFLAVSGRTWRLRWEQPGYSAESSGKVCTGYAREASGYSKRCRNTRGGRAEKRAERKRRATTAGRAANVKRVRRCRGR